MAHSLWAIGTLWDIFWVKRDAQESTSTLWRSPCLIPWGNPFKNTWHLVICVPWAASCKAFPNARKKVWHIIVSEVTAGNRCKIICRYLSACTSLECIVFGFDRKLCFPYKFECASNHPKFDVKICTESQAIEQFFCQPNAQIRLGLEHTYRLMSIRVRTLGQPLPPHVGSLVYFWHSSFTRRCIPQ